MSFKWCLEKGKIKEFSQGKALREDADYYDDWSKTGSEEVLKLAEEFLNKARDLTRGDLS
jgi:hypothetical protein